MLADSVGLALLVVLDTLTPAERLALIELMHTTALAEGRDPEVLQYTRWGSIDMERGGAENKAGAPCR